MEEELKINDVLYTRDGRKIGNAIVVGIKDVEKRPTIYVVKTDYDNIVEGNMEQIKDSFYTEQTVSPTMAKIYPHRHSVLVKGDVKGCIMCGNEPEFSHAKYCNFCGDLMGGK